MLTVFRGESGLTVKLTHLTDMAVYVSDRLTCLACVCMCQTVKLTHVYVPDSQTDTFDQHACACVWLARRQGRYVMKLATPRTKRWPWRRTLRHCHGKCLMRKIVWRTTSSRQTLTQPWLTRSVSQATTVSHTLELKQRWLAAVGGKDQNTPTSWKNHFGYVHGTEENGFGTDSSCLETN